MNSFDVIKRGSGSTEVLQDESLLSIRLGLTKCGSFVRRCANSLLKLLEHQPRAFFDHLLRTLHRLEALGNLRRAALVPEANIGSLEVRIEAGQVGGCAQQCADGSVVTIINGLLDKGVPLLAGQVLRVGTNLGADALCRSEEHTSELQSPLNLVCR